MGRAARGKTAAELLDAVDAEALRAFLREVFVERPSYARRFVQLHGEPDIETLRESLIADLDQAEWQNSDDGWIDWRHGMDFARAFNGAVAQYVDTAIAGGRLSQALELSLAAFVWMLDLEIDDSDGFISDAIEGGAQCWKRILGHPACDDGVRRMVYDRLSDYAADVPKPLPGREGDQTMRVEYHTYQEERIESFLVGAYADHPDYAASILEITDRRIAELFDRLAEFNGRRSTHGKTGQPVFGTNRYYDGQIARWVQVHLRCMEALGLPFVERDAFARPYRALPDVCQYFVDHAVASDNLDEAARLLEGMRDRSLNGAEKAYPGIVGAQLVNVYERLGERDAAIAEIKRLIEHGGTTSGPQNSGYYPFGLRGAPSKGGDTARSAKAPQSSVDWFIRLKTYYGDEDWPSERDAFLATLRDGRVLCECLEEEGLHDRLIDTIERSGDVWLLKSYEGDLCKRYPERVIGVYRTDLANLDKHVGRNRSQYRGFAQQLRHITELPGGRTLVSEIKARIKEEYPRHWALQEEVAQV